MAGPIDELLSSTVKNWVDDNAADNIFNTHAIHWEIKRRKGIKGFAGGERLVAPIEYATNPTVGFIPKTGKIQLTEADVVTSAEYHWKILAGAIVLNEPDLRKNRGEYQMVNLVETKTRNALSTIRQSMVSSIFATSQGADDFLNWQSIFRATGTIGGISPTAYSWWAGKYDNTAEPLTIEDMFGMYNQASGGSDPPKSVITGRVLYEKYNSTLQAQQRFTDADMAGAGFENLKFHAAAVIWDEQAIADEMWFWNPKYLYLGVLPEHVDKPEVDAFLQIPDQLGKASRVWMMGNWVCTNRRRLGALDGRTA